MPFRERLGPRIHKGPVQLGHRLGESIGVGQNRHFGIDGDYYGSWGYELKIINPTHAMVLLHYEGPGGFPVSEHIGTYKKGAVNSSVAKDVIRWVGR